MIRCSGVGRGLLVAFILAICLAVPSMAAPPMQDGGVHVVTAGETLATIAARYGTTAAAIARANGLSNQNYIYAGQRLTIPSAVVSAGGTHVVSYGESLSSIALQYGVNAEAIARANGLANQNFVYAGQKLVIPGSSHGTSISSGASASAGGSVHIVEAGQGLSDIANAYGVSAAALASHNGITNPNFIYVGQRLEIPAAGAAVSSGGTAGSDISGRWIDIDLSTQSLTAYEGNQAVFWSRVSTGLPATPTVPGQYTIQTKYPAVDMSGPGYYLPGVPWTMFFYRGYAIHGTYWHNNFGSPMSHGCVNLTTPDAKWVYDFASIGTPVVIHY